MRSPRALLVLGILGAGGVLAAVRQQLKLEVIDGSGLVESPAEPRRARRLHPPARDQPTLGGRARWRRARLRAARRRIRHAAPGRSAPAGSRRGRTEPEASSRAESVRRHSPSRPSPGRGLKAGDPEVHGMRPGPRLQAPETESLRPRTRLPIKRPFERKVPDRKQSLSEPAGTGRPQRTERCAGGQRHAVSRENRAERLRRLTSSARGSATGLGRIRRSLPRLTRIRPMRPRR